MVHYKLDSESARIVFRERSAPSDLPDRDQNILHQ